MNRKKKTRFVNETMAPDPPGGYENYISFQKKINCNKGEIDPVLLQEHIDNMMQNGWEEVEVNFNLIRAGDQIRYTTLLEGKYLFRTGGWAVAFDQANEPPEWMTYISHTYSNWCIQRETCKRLFRRHKGWKSHLPKKPKLIKFNPPNEETEFSSYLPDLFGVEQRIRSFKSKGMKDKFEASKKFETAKETGWIFIE